MAVEGVAAAVEMAVGEAAVVADEEGLIYLTEEEGNPSTLSSCMESLISFTVV
jgi:hypothetical protein